MKTRIKFHQMPGDVGKKQKISMMEGRSEKLAERVWSVSKKNAKKWKKGILLVRERAILKRRTQQEIKQEITPL